MEVWKDAIDYEGLYQVSDLGRVKSLWYGKEKILKPGIDSQGYYFVCLCKNKKQKNHLLHRLVYQSFNGKTNLQVDHIIEGNRLDNRLCNLQALSNRENITKHRLTKNKSSKFTGVYWCKRAKKWKSSISINSKTLYLGYYNNELDAANAYQASLNKLS